MIAGMVQIEDHTIQFRVVDNGLIEFTACDNLTGKQYGMQVTNRQFTLAMFLALSNDPDQYPEDFWTAAECCMPDEDLKECRWIT